MKTRPSVRARRWVFSNGRPKLVLNKDSVAYLFLSVCCHSETPEKFAAALLREMDVILQAVGVFEEAVFHLATLMCHCIV